MKNFAIIGGGAAGMFCAANIGGKTHMTVFESSEAPLKKVLLTGGGRCNFTNENIDGGRLEKFYPRGARNLRKPFRAFGAADTAKYFLSLGVKTKTEEGGRMFPQSDNSADIAEALVKTAKSHGAEIRTNARVEKIERTDDGKYSLSGNFGTEIFDGVLVAAGGAVSDSIKESLEKLGHTFEPPAPSLYALKLDVADSPAWAELSGISTVAEISAPSLPEKISARGAVLITHFGIGGPAVLEFSSFGAREFQKAGHNFDLRINWICGIDDAALKSRLVNARAEHAKKLVVNAPLFDIPKNLWVWLVSRAQINQKKIYAEFSKDDEKRLVPQLRECRFGCVGRATHKAEFVTCGGVRRDEIDFASMQSKTSPNLFFAGEFVDIDAITGGFNLQAAWTTAKICADFVNKCAQSS